MTIIYDPVAGTFTGGGSRDTSGRLFLRYEGQYVRASHLAVFLMTGEWPTLVDHEDGDPSNDKWSNLRSTTQKENMRNRAQSVTSSRPLMGVVLHRNGRWYAVIKKDRKVHSLGGYSTLFETACARKSAEIRFGFHHNHGRIA